MLLFPWSVCFIEPSEVFGLIDKHSSTTPNDTPIKPVFVRKNHPPYRRWRWVWMKLIELWNGNQSSDLTGLFICFRSHSLLPPLDS
ncbi:MAG: hypothetical protein J0M12_08460 [Deltaproteobacteria bacterium]|nr:hypothetical protein [Deltaproteobacteria bacterium]